MKRIALVSCGKSKRRDPVGAPVDLGEGRSYQAYQRYPLRDLYTGSLFRAARRDVERSGIEWFVVSALHGVRRPDYQAVPYDLTIRAATWDDSVRRSWGERCSRELAGFVGRLGEVQIELHMGSDYARWLLPHLPNANHAVSGPIGTRLRAYRLRREGADATGQVPLFRRSA